MVNIYKIVNDVNNMVYIGQTHETITQRFAEHCADAHHSHRCHRPLYVAMNSIGKEHFHPELIEVTENGNEREQYWIEQYDSFHNGYNATYGGVGKPYVDYGKVLDLYDNTRLSLTAIATKCKCSKDSVNIIVTKNRGSADWESRVTFNQVQCVNTGQCFGSCSQAAKWLVEQGKITNDHSGRTQIALLLRTSKTEFTYAGYRWLPIK